MTQGSVVYLNLGGVLASVQPAVLLLVDVSGSMQGEDKLGQVKVAIRKLVNETPADIGLVAFNDGITTLAEIGTDREALLRASESMHASGGTALFKSIVDCASLLSAVEDRRRCLIVLSDGEDTGGSSAEAAVKACNEESLTVACVGVGNGVRALEPFAKGTGATVVEATNATQIVNAMAASMARVLAERSVVHVRSEVERLEAERLASSETFHLSVDTEEGAGATTHHWSDGARRTALAVRNAQANSDEITDVLAKRLSEEATARLQNRAEQAVYDVIVVGRTNDPHWPALERVTYDAILQARESLGIAALRFRLLTIAIHSNPNYRRTPTETGAVSASLWQWWRDYAGALPERPRVRVPDVTRKTAIISFSALHPRLNRAGTPAIPYETQLFAAATLAAAHRGIPEVADLTFDRTTDFADRAFEDSLLAPVYVEGILRSRRQVDVSVARTVQDWCDRALDTADTAVAVERANGLFDPSWSVNATRQSLMAPVAVRDPANTKWTKDNPLLRGTLIAYEDLLDAVASGDDAARAFATTLEERAESWTVGVVQSLRREMDLRAAKLIEERALRIGDSETELVVGTRPSGIATASATLRMIRERLRADAVSVQSQSDPEQFDMQGIGVVPKTMGLGDAERSALSRDGAMKLVVQLLRERPSGVAYGLRSVLSTLAVGTAVTLGLATLGVGLIVQTASAAIAAAAVGGVGIVQWRHRQQRLRAATRDYVEATKREVRLDMARACIAAIRSIYDRLADWIGEEPEFADTAAPRLTLDGPVQQHLLARWRTALEEFRDRAAGGGLVRSEVANPYVIEAPLALDEFVSDARRRMLQNVDDDRPLAALLKRWREIDDQAPTRSQGRAQKAFRADVLTSLMTASRTAVEAAWNDQQVLEAPPENLRTGIHGMWNRLQDLRWPPIRLRNEVIDDAFVRRERLVLPEGVESKSATGIREQDRALDVVRTLSPVEFGYFTVLSLATSDAVDLSQLREAWERTKEGQESIRNAQPVNEQQSDLAAGGADGVIV